MQTISYSVTCSLDHSSGAVYLSTVTKNSGSCHICLFSDSLGAGNTQAFVLVLFCVALGKPSCTNFMKAYTGVDDLICGTMSDLKMICHIVSCDPSLKITSWTYPMFSSTVEADGHHSYSTLVTLVQVFLNWSFHFYMLGQ